VYGWRRGRRRTPCTTYLLCCLPSLGGVEWAIETAEPVAAAVSFMALAEGHHRRMSYVFSRSIFRMCIHVPCSRVCRHHPTRRSSFESNLGLQYLFVVTCDCVIWFHEDEQVRARRDTPSSAMDCDEVDFEKMLELEDHERNSAEHGPFDGPGPGCSRCRRAVAYAGGGRDDRWCVRC